MKDMGESTFVLGIQIYRDRKKGLLGLSQRAYIDRVLKRFNMSNCSAGDAPMVKGDKFNKKQCPRNDFEKNWMANKPYASAVGSLMYAQVCTRPDIAFAVSVLGRFQSNAGATHWTAAKKVMRYLQSTKDYMLVYGSSDNLELVGYTDSDYGGCTDDLKSTSGYVFLMSGGAVSWRSAKQTIVATSTMHAEFMALYEATKQAVWLKGFVSGLKIVDSIHRPLMIYCDNDPAVSFAKNNRKSSASKHIEIKYLMVKEKMTEGLIMVEHISTDQMIADPLTKALSVGVFKGHVPSMGVVDSFDVLS